MGKQYIQVCDSFRLPTSPEPVVKKLTKIKKIALELRNAVAKLASPSEVKALNYEVLNQSKKITRPIRWKS